MRDLDYSMYLKVLDLIRHGKRQKEIGVELKLKPQNLNGKVRQLQKMKLLTRIGRGRNVKMEVTADGLKALESLSNIRHNVIPAKTTVLEKDKPEYIADAIHRDGTEQWTSDIEKKEIWLKVTELVSAWHPNAGIEEQRRGVNGIMHELSLSSNSERRIMIDALRKAHVRTIREKKEQNRQKVSDSELVLEIRNNDRQRGRTSYPVLKRTKDPTLSHKLAQIRKAAKDEAKNKEQEIKKQLPHKGGMGHPQSRVVW